MVPSRFAIIQRPIVDQLAPGFGQLLAAYLFGVSPHVGYQRHRIQALPPIGESAGLFIHYQLRGVDGLPQGSGIGLGHQLQRVDVVKLHSFQLRHPGVHVPRHRDVHNQQRPARPGPHGLSDDVYLQQIPGRTTGADQDVRFGELPGQVVKGRSHSAQLLGQLLRPPMSAIDNRYSSDSGI